MTKGPIGPVSLGRRLHEISLRRAAGGAQHVAEQLRLAGRAETLEAWRGLEVFYVMYI